MKQRVEPIADAEALFRYELISIVMYLERLGASRRAAVREVASTTHDDRGKLRRVGERTVWRWLRDYQNDGLSGLTSRASQRASSDAISARLLSFIKAERESDLAASIPELLRRARMSRVIGVDEKISRTSLWRAMKRAGIETQRKKRQAARDAKRRFSFAGRMQMVMADFKHFQVGRTRRKRVALYLLDDATRYGLGVWISTSEQAVVMLRALWDVITMHGLMDVLYFDRGSAFRAEDVLQICARISIHAILGSPHYPEGRGKIERFNRSVDERVIAGLDGADHAPDADEALRLLLRHDLALYNGLPHEALSGQTPKGAWSASERVFKAAPEGEALHEAFSVPLKRTVSADNVISVSGMAYEMPRGYARERVEIWRRPLSQDALYFQHEDSWMQLHEVDREANAIRPPKRRDDDAQIQSASSPASSQRSLHNNLSSMVDSHGNFKG